MTHVAIVPAFFPSLLYFSDGELCSSTLFIRNLEYSIVLTTAEIMLLQNIAVGESPTDEVNFV